MIQYGLLKISPRLLRLYRTQFLLDSLKIIKMIPNTGKLLDVGCGVGLLDYKIGQLSPELSIFGIDINKRSVELAKAYNLLPNIKYLCTPLKSIEGKFNCILFVDVFHHVEPIQYRELLETSSQLLSPKGFLIIKDIERHKGEISIFMDRYISGCKEIYMNNCDELVKIISKYMNVTFAEVRFRFPFPHFYIKAEKS
jgi:2-polyprenyl-3-methyl-5-hydroxy-6-metoxy-1,4-benzoquinol methylase